MQSKAKQLISSIFSLDSGFMRFCERIFDLTLLNLFFVLTCLPVVTVGISKLSLFTCLHRMEEQKIVPWREYLKVFRGNVREGLLLGIGEVVIIGICLMDIVLLSQQTSFIAQLIKILSFGVLILLTITSFYLYPIASRYQLAPKELLWKSFLMASWHFPKTVLLLAVVGCLFLALASSAVTLLLGMSLLTVIGWTLLAYLIHYLVGKALNKSTQPSNY